MSTYQAEILIGISLIRVLEQAQILLHVVGSFEERLRIPIAAGHSKEVASMDVDRARQA